MTQGIDRTKKKKKQREVIKRKHLPLTHRCQLDESTLKQKFFFFSKGVGIAMSPKKGGEMKKKGWERSILY